MRRVTMALSALLAVWLTASPASAALAPTVLYPLVVDALSGPVAGEPTDVQVVLASGTIPLTARPLTLLARPYGAPGFTVIGHATTSASGLATLSVTLTQSAVLRWTFDGDSTYAAAVSPDSLVQIAPRVGLRVNDRTLRRGQRLVVRGHTFPAKAGCSVKLWRGELRPLVSGPAPVRLAVSTVHADGTYRLARRFHRRGRMRIAVTVTACAGNGRGLSPYVRIRVR